MDRRKNNFRIIKMNDLLNKIFVSANLTEEQKEKYINEINLGISIRVLESIYKLDKELAVKLADAIKNSETDQSALNLMITKLKENSQMKEIINKTAEDVLTEFLQEIAKSTTEEQKQQILSSLSS